MIGRQRGKIYFQCDECGEELATGESDWNEAWTRAKCEMWQARKNDDQWEHRCPECVDGGS